MGESIEDVDYYALLEIDSSATLKQISTAYRKKSLKVHPDRNPDNPDAASLFHDLSIAHNVLSDPTQRASFDALLAARNARKQRFAGLDSKRKALAEDLDRREREFKKSKGEEDAAGRKQRGELERLKEEGRRMREERDKAAHLLRNRDNEVDRLRAAQAAAAATASASSAHPLGPLDTTLRLKWLKATHPTLTTPEALSTFLAVLLAPSPPDIDSVVVTRPKEGKKPKAKDKGSAVVAFRTLSAAVRLVERAREGRGDKAWEDVEVAWAGGRPEVLGGPETEEEGVGGKATPPPAPARGASAFPTSMLVDSDEDRILAQLRARERERLIAEMKAADEEGP